MHNAVESKSTNRPSPTPVTKTAFSRRAWITLLTVMLIGVGLDLVSKSLAFEHVAGNPVQIDRSDVLAAGRTGIHGLVPPHPPRVVIPKVLEFRLVLNPGAVFGIGPGKRWFFVVFTLVAIGMAVWAFLAWTRPRDRWAHVGLGLILAGGLGNLYDRLVFGCVRDFLHPLPGVRLPFGLTWPNGARDVWPWVSNVADAVLLIGIVLLTLHLWRLDRQLRAEQDAAKSESQTKPEHQE